MIIIIVGLILAVISGTTPARAQSDSTLRFCLAGDIMLGRGVKKLSDKYGAGYPFAGTCSLTAGTDITLGNLESPLTSTEYQSTSPWRFKGDTTAAAQELKNAGFDLLSLANNHALDCGIPGLDQCVRSLDSAGISYSGLSQIEVDSTGDTTVLCRPAFFTVKNKKIGLVAFCQPYLLKIARDHGAENIAPAESACVARSIAAIRDSCDIIIASFHWGSEYKDLPTWTQKKLGRLAVDCGAKIVHGHHPHVLQGAEFYNDGLIAYSLGNFIFDQRHTLPRQSALLFVQITNDSLSQVSLVPLDIAQNRPVPASSQTAKGINKRMIGLCRKLGTEARIIEGSLVLTPLKAKPLK